jgi:hypothetical protein
MESRIQPRVGHLHPLHEELCEALGISLNDVVNYDSSPESFHLFPVCFDEAIEYPVQSPSMSAMTDMAPSVQPLSLEESIYQSLQEALGNSTFSSSTVFPSVPQGQFFFPSQQQPFFNTPSLFSQSALQQHQFQQQHQQQQSMKSEQTVSSSVASSIKYIKEDDVDAAIQPPAKKRARKADASQRALQQAQSGELVQAPWSTHFAHLSADVVDQIVVALRYQPSVSQAANRKAFRISNSDKIPDFMTGWRVCAPIERSLASSVAIGVTTLKTQKKRLFRPGLVKSEHYLVKVRFDPTQRGIQTGDTIAAKVKLVYVGTGSQVENVLVDGMQEQQVKYGPDQCVAVRLSFTQFTHDAFRVVIELQEAGVVVVSPQTVVFSRRPDNFELVYSCGGRKEHNPPSPVHGAKSDPEL